MKQLTRELTLTGPERKNAIVELAALSPACHFPHNRLPKEDSE